MNAAHQYEEIEERLEAVTAPEPPGDLLEKIQGEIPDHLTAVADEPATRGSVRAWRRWRPLAAAVVLFLAGGVLGYHLLREAPGPGELPVPAPSPGPIAEKPPEPVELGEPAVGEVRGASDAHEANEVPAPSSSPPGASESAAAGEADAVAPSGTAGRSSRPGTVLEDRMTVVGEAPARDDQVLRQGASVQEPSPDATAVAEPGPGAEDGRAQPSAAGPVSKKAELGERTSGDAPIAAAPPPPPAAEPEATVRANGEADPRRGREIGSENARIERSSVASAEEHVALQRQLDELEAAGARGQVPKPRPVPPVTTVAPSTGGTAEPNDRPYGDMFFQGYGTHPFVDVEDDPLSTFALDVDTGSYTLARSYLERGALPPGDAIRVEEFVNFFDYRDPAPRARDFSVVAEGAPSPFTSTARTWLLRFALKGREIAERDRLPAVLTFVVDVSGSMNRENRLGLVQRALRLLVERLDEGDAVGLVVYGSRGEVLLEPTSDHRRVLAAIDRLRPGGATNAEEGLVLAYDVARRAYRRGAINRVILCSDGVANVGNTGPGSILARIGREADSGIELTTVGFGMGNYNDVLMEQLADQGDGSYAYVDDLGEARRVFVENLTGTLQTIAGDAKAQVEFDPRAVQSYRLLGYENRDVADRDFRNDAIDAGEIGAGHRVTALYEVKLRPDAPRGGKIATFRLRYESRRSGRVVEDSVDLTRSDLAPSWREASPGLRLAAVAAEFAERLKGSYWARETSAAELIGHARAAARGFGPDAAELVRLIETAARLVDGHGVEDDPGEPEPRPRTDGGDGLERVDG